MLVDALAVAEVVAVVVLVVVGVEGDGEREDGGTVEGVRRNRRLVVGVESIVGYGSGMEELDGIEEMAVVVVGVPWVAPNRGRVLERERRRMKATKRQTNYNEPNVSRYDSAGTQGFLYYSSLSLYQTSKSRCLPSGGNSGHLGFPL